MRYVSGLERRHRLVRRHHLVKPAGSIGETARSVVALHSSDPATVFLSIRARRPSVTVAGIEKTLYESKTLVRVLGMRRTMWVADLPTAIAINGSSTRFLAGGQRKRTISMLDRSGLGADAEHWLDDTSQAIVDVLNDVGEASAKQLVAKIPELGRRIPHLRADGSTAGEMGASTRLLFLLAAEARVLRAQPLGSWVSSQYRWTTPERWLGRSLGSMPAEEARDQIVAAWLQRFGPGRETDIKWWTGWTISAVRDSLERVEAEKVALEDGATGFIAKGDDDFGTLSSDVVSLLPSLDPATMGWKERGFYIGSGTADLFDRNGNAGPTVWLNGTVVGGWAQTRSGQIETELLREVTSSQKDRLNHEAAGLREWLGDARITPRFRSPSDKRLAVT